ncbi:MAG: hypothetical protein A2Z97_06560 [Bdellovibrionales bacterium GWB1_52_6]|nr:MAG: hypothetical protein A2Z97_06560 [Bdellovibrionales bacterium GWB1_52_6]
MLSSITPPRAWAEAQQPSVGEQIATDLIAGGITVGAALSGSLPIAMAAGFLTKYISTYGVQGIKAVIDYFKGYQPKDLGEINLYYIYLLDVKRNLYQSLITIRKATDQDGAFANIQGELQRVEDVLKGACQIESGCEPQGLDDSLINYSFLNIILDAKESIEVSKYLSANEVKDTYQYLMLLYMDLIIVEQKLLDAQYNVLAGRMNQTLKLLKRNAYLSNAEKEYQTQLLLNMSLRWMNLADTRRVVIAKALKSPLETLEKENSELARQIDEYKRKHSTFMLDVLANNENHDDKYNDYMKRIEKDMKEAGRSVDVFDQNPFQTGTALSGYYLNEKTLLLERDTFFQMKANKLKSTEEVADYHYRVKILRAHANNMLLQLIQAVDQRNNEGIGKIEQPKHAVALEKLIEDCKKDAACVANLLKNPETAVQNILIDNFRLAAQIFGQIPYLNVLEVNAVYQLIQLIYVEVLYSQNILSGIEFQLFYEKQKTLEESIRKNTSLTDTERRMNTAMVVNTVDKWKKRILERKFDHTAEFAEKAQSLQQANRAILTQLQQLRVEHAMLFNGIYNKNEFCFWPVREWRWCKARKGLLSRLDDLSAGKLEFLGAEESKLPGDFWEELATSGSVQ